MHNAPPPPRDVAKGGWAERPSRPLMGNRSHGSDKSSRTRTRMLLEEKPLARAYTSTPPHPPARGGGGAHTHQYVQLPSIEGA